MGTSARLTGFTLIECAACVAVLGTGAAMLAPFSDGVRDNRFKFESFRAHREIAGLQGMYMSDNNGAFTGPNTSGLAWNREPFGNAPNPGIDTLAFDTDGTNPTSQGDWLTPLLAMRYELSPNRAMRMHQMFDTVADPFAARTVDAVYGNAPDRAQFELIQQKLGYRQRSFLMMRSFVQLSSEQDDSDVVIEPEDGFLYREHFGVQNENATALSPVGYMPNLVNVGTQLSNKVMFADGTRYLSMGELDFDLELFDARFPNGSSSGPIHDDSVAYGRGIPAFEGNQELSFRKRGGRGLLVTMFDGSTQYMSKEQAFTDPTPWYPSGSVWTGNGATPESAAFVAKNLPGGVIP